MSIDTYTNLKAEILDWLDDSLSTKIDTFIDLAEARMNRELRIRSMLKRGDASLDTTTRYLALPTGYRQMWTFRLLTDPLTVLKHCNIHEMNRRVQSTSGKPGWYTTHEEIEFDRKPDSAYSAEMIYFASLTPISTTNETTAVFLAVPDLYLWGALLAAEPYLDNDERIPTWQGNYDRVLASANDEFIKGQHTGAPQIARVSGPTP